MTYRARLIDGGSMNDRPLAATTLEEARAEIADELSRVAAEGRPLPSAIELLADEPDTRALVGELTPRKGCCSGWEILWRTPNATDPVAIDPL